MEDFKIIPLSKRPEFAEACAVWCHEEWPHIYGLDTPEKWVSRFQERIGNTNKIPLTWLSLKGEKLVGIASLIEYEDRDFYGDEFKPWLVGVFTNRAHRNKGVASSLLTNIHSEARRIGFSEIYLTTTDAQQLYLKNGWQTLKTCQHPDEGTVSLMKRDI